MASILDQYGIKEVADLTFYHLSEAGTPDYPVLFIDTAKVSTLEFTAETTDARGGKGNPKLITWDFGKEITVSIEDALFSAKSMAIMFGNGKAREFTRGLIMKTETFRAKEDNSDAEAAGWDPKFVGPDGKLYVKHNAKFFDADNKVHEDDFVKGQVYFCSFDLLASGAVIEVSANSFPGTYWVEGDTFARSYNTGDDEFFKFIIPKAKVTSENTITLEAEGDPSVFNMNLTVLRPESGDMVQLIKYNLEDPEDAGEDDFELVHNHILLGENTEPVPEKEATVDGYVDLDGSKKKYEITVDKTATLTDDLQDVFNANGNYDALKAATTSAGKKASVITLPMKVGSYEVKQVNPALEYYSEDPRVTPDPWTKTFTYDVTEADTYGFIGITGDEIKVTIDGEEYSISVK